MSKKEKLREQIQKLESELHDLEVIDWWQERPHILEFRSTFNYESDDEGGSTPYFRPYNIKLNEIWIAENQEVWSAFCNSSKRYSRPIKPDVDQLNDDWDFYFRNISDSSNYEYDYPNFEQFDEKTMRNPNYAN